MNWRIVVQQLGMLVLVLTGAVLLVGAWSLLQYWNGHPTEALPLRAFGATIGIGGIVGSTLWYVGRGVRAQPGRREAILLVALSWFVGAALAALPFRFWAAYDAPTTEHRFAHFADCYFEAMSGLSTTGASVLTDISALPRSLLLWRSLIQWLGGLGIVVLFVAVLPLLGVGGKHLFRTEAPGPTPEGVKPRIQETARTLWLVYLCLTLVEILALKLADMSLFDAVCHSFTTLATGGFSTHNASVGGFNSLAVDIIIIVFMFAAGVNFGLYYYAIRHGWRSVLADTELRCYVGIVVIASAVIVFALNANPLVITTGTESVAGVGDSIRHGVFQVVSMQTTTGFCTSDFNRWGFVAKAVLLVLMFIGGSAGSTGGGIKVIRCVVVLKVMWTELEHVFRPQAVRAVKIGRAAIDADTKLTTLIYFLGIGVLTAAGGAALMVTEADAGIDPTTAFTASVATLNNIGPGLGLVGAVNNFGWMSAPGKCVLSVLMALGRLEVFTIAVLFFPRFWKTN